MKIKLLRSMSVFVMLLGTSTTFGMHYYYGQPEIKQPALYDWGTPQEYTQKSWTETLKRKLFSGFSLEDQKAKLYNVSKTVSPYLSSALIRVGSLKLISSICAKIMSLSPGNNVGMTFLSAEVFSFLFTVRYMIPEIIAAYNAHVTTEQETKAQLKTTISLFIADPLLCPTHSSKVYVLKHVSEFLPPDLREHPFIKEICEQMITELPEPMPTDAEIDEKINDIEGSFSSNQPLDERIKQLSDAMTTTMTPELKAQLSVLLRLQRQKALK